MKDVLHQVTKQMRGAAHGESIKGCWKRLALVVCGTMMLTSAYGQQALGQRARVKSPIVNEDGTVTFNFFDPTA